MTDRGHTDPAAQYVDRLAGYDQRLQMLERSHTHEPDSPVGAMVDWPSPTLPDLWLPADGRSLLVAAYPDLFAVLAYRFGGSGANFNLPNTVDRMAVAVGQRALGAVGGQQTVSLAPAQTGAHTHSFTASTGNESGDHHHDMSHTTGNDAPEHTHSGTTGAPNAAHAHNMGMSPSIDAVAGTTAYGITGGGNTGPDLTTHAHPFTSGGASARHAHGYSGQTGGQTADHNHAIVGNTDSSGLGQAHENMPPWIALYKIIKVLPSIAAAHTALTIIERSP